MNRTGLKSLIAHVWEETCISSTGEKLLPEVSPIAIVIAPDNIHPEHGLIRAGGKQSDALFAARNAITARSLREVKSIIAEDGNSKRAESVVASQKYPCLAIIRNELEFFEIAIGWESIGTCMGGISDIDWMETSEESIVVWASDCSQFKQEN